MDNANERADSGTQATENAAQKQSTLQFRIARPAQIAAVITVRRIQEPPDCSTYRTDRGTPQRSTRRSAPTGPRHAAIDPLDRGRRHCLIGANALPLALRPYDERVAVPAKELATELKPIGVDAEPRSGLERRRLPQNWTGKEQEQREKQQRDRKSVV